jgi:predicted metal-dependent phosphoesterase TrpH
LVQTLKWYRVILFWRNKMKADLHIHSIYSHDAISKPESIFEAAITHNINTIAITDHDTTAGWAPLYEASKKYPVKLVFGQEVKIYRDKIPVGELLCLFLEKPIKSKTVADVIKEVNAQNGIVSIAHPFSERRIEFRAYADIADWDHIAIETRNGRCYNSRDNEMAVSLADRLKTAITAGSDAHTPFEVGSVYVEYDGHTINDLKNEIINKNVQVGGHTTSFLFSALSSFGRLGIAV